MLFLQNTLIWLFYYGYQLVGWHHGLNGHESEKNLGDGEGQGSLECYSPWGCKESDTTEELNNNNSYRLLTNIQ